MEMTKFLERFKVPTPAFEVINRMINPNEIELLEALTNEAFTLEEAYQLLNKISEKDWSIDAVKEFLLSAYKRGVIELEDDTYENYRIGSFYTRLDIYAISETEEWLRLSNETRKALNDWYFDAYFNKLDPAKIAPTLDKVVTLVEAKEYVDSQNGQIWLNKCDCRTLSGECGNVTDVCISFRSGLNTFSHRGLSREISQEQAKAVLDRASEAGLMHTINPGGICNCCGDCCYLFKAQQRLSSNPAWPSAKWIAVFNKRECINCELCVNRCHFGAFKLVKGEIEYIPDLCRGCGLCKETCPSGAIDLVKRG